MTIFKKIFIFASCAVMAACVSKPQLQAPPKTLLSNKVEIYRAAALDRVDQTAQHLNDKKDVMYVQNYGGGGVGLGLLAGPLGVAANIKMIKNKTLEEVDKLKGKLKFDVANLFSASLSNNGVSVEAASGFKINPYILVQRIYEKQISIAVAVFVDNQSNFPAKYIVQLSELYELDQLASLSEVQLEKINAEMINGYDDIIRILKKESSADLLAEKRVLVKSEFLSPRIMFEIQANLIEETNDTIWIRGVGMVTRIQKLGAEIKPAKK